MRPLTYAVELTNLRQGIQQGRQAGNTGPATGSFNLGTSHQQER